MALIQPIVGHLLSQYKETVSDGIEKLNAHIKSNNAFANEFAADPQAVSALMIAARKSPELMDASFKTISQLITVSSNTSRMTIARELCSKANFQLIRSGLAVLSEANLATTLCCFSVLSTLTKYCPRVVLGRFGGEVPLNLASFRPQLPFPLRRVREARLQFLTSIAQSKYSATTKAVVCTHGYLTQLLEDAAEVLQAATPDSLNVVNAVLDVFNDHFLCSRIIDLNGKKELLLAQRNIFRLLVKALAVEAVAEKVADIIYRMVVEMAEPSSDYAVSRTESDDKGMPNFIVYSILRQLRPKNSSIEASLVAFIAQRCPDLIRPYFVRVSAHLAEENNQRNASKHVSRIAVLNVMTRIMMAPLPYHLAAGVAQLQASESASHQFFSLSPKNVADEICPSWLKEFVHKIINGSSNIMLLVLATQLTYATLCRASQAKKMISAVHRHQVANGTSAVDFEAFESELSSLLATYLPSHQEFWHRLTQQLHRILTEPQSADTRAGSNEQAKAHFAMQRLYLLTEKYTELFQLRAPWLSAVPLMNPLASWNCPRTITLVLKSQADTFLQWEPKSVSTLCSLFASNLVRGVSLAKIHHIQHGVVNNSGSSWPLLLSMLSWFLRKRNAPKSSSEETMEALSHIARLVLLCVHSVSIRYAADMEEIVLWLTELNVESLPCFLHILDVLLQRNTSTNASERATPDHGILAQTALATVAKVAQKKEAAEQTKELSKGPKSIWQLDFDTNITAFEKVTQSVVAAWPKRGAVYQKFLASVASSLASTSVRGRKQLEVAVLNNQLTATTSVVPLFTQLGEFCKTLAISTAPCDTDIAALQAIDAACAKANALRELSKVLAPAKQKEGGQWMLSSYISWYVSKKLIELDSASNTADEEQVPSSQDDVFKFCASIVTFAAGRKSVWTAEYSNGTEQRCGGFFVMLLLCLQHLLRQRLANALVGGVGEEAIESLGAAIMCTYTGTISTIDRLRYACLLHLHYLSAKCQLPAATEAATAVVAPSSDDEAEDEVIVTKKEKPHAHEGVKLDTCVVPRAIQLARFITNDTIVATHVTPEVDVLAQLVDSWTESDCNDITGPLRLSNAVYVRTKHTAESTAPQLWRAVFPDVLSNKDRTTCNISLATIPSLTDPRYLLPLVNTVGAIAHAKPQAAPTHLMTKCFSQSLRALSFTDPTLRKLAANCLALTKSLSPMRRALLNFARLKTLQLEVKNARRGQVQALTNAPPRLPSGLSAFLVMSQGPVHHYNNFLHNDVINFLCDLKTCFSATVPMKNILAAFPIGCITNPIMTERHQELQRGQHGQQRQTDVVGEGTKAFTSSLASQAPTHLEHILAQVERSCGTVGDMKALVHQNILVNLMTLINMTSSVPRLRERMLSVLETVCCASAEVGAVAAVEGQVLPWATFFLSQLLHEFNTDVDMFAEPLFLGVLRLIAKLYPLYHHKFASFQHQQHTASMAAVVQSLRQKGASSKAVWDAVDDVMRAMEPAKKTPAN